MCGFVGALNLYPGETSQKQLDQGLKFLDHRGPDSEGRLRVAIGEWQIAIGHKRLKIIDLDDRAAQPFCYGHLIVLFNGELYNYIELRNELRNVGFNFKTESDTEVLAIAFQYWGKNCFSRFDGMFAVVLIDTLNHKIVFARDRFGEKPLHIFSSAQQIVFGSTIDCLLPLLNGSSPDINYDWLNAFLHSGFAPAPMTIWNGIEKLAVGVIREFDLRSKLWSSTCQAAHDLIDNSYPVNFFKAAEFENILETSLRRRLRADVPVALLLSGGIDSSYVAALVRRKLDLPLTAVTIHDRTDSNEEVERAIRICQKFGIKHHTLSFPKKTLNQLVETALPAMDEPISDPAFPMLVELFSHVPRDFRVVLTGDGSDEIFLSYIDYCRLLKNRSGFRGWVAGKVAKRLLNIAAQVDINIFFRIAKRIIMEANLPIGERFDMLQAYSSWGVADGMPWFESLKAKDDGPAALWRYSLAHKLPEYLLVKADRASMYYSFESRTPYLNHDLFQYFFSCKFKNSFLGKKNIILNRLNEFLGEELGFTKRGFFASGQNHIYRDSNATWHSLLQDYFKDRLNDLSFLNRIDSMTYYRLYILNSWIKMKCV